jgi:Trp operon repressor
VREKLIEKTKEAAMQKHNKQTFKLMEMKDKEQETKIILTMMTNLITKREKNELPEDIQIIAQLPLPESQQQAKRLIEKSLKENSISEQELDKEN